MSLINKMLQDLDARASGGAASAVQQDEVKPVPSMERDRRPMLLGGAVAGVLVIAAGGWYGWQYWQAHQAPPPAPPQPVRVIDNRVPGQPRFQEPPAAKPAEPASVAAVSAASGVKPAPAAREDDATAARGEAKSPRPARSASSHAAEGTDARAEPAPRKAARGPAAAPSTGEGVVQTPKQLSENSYRRALAALQEGRVSAALAELDKAVEIDPRNDAARQTYVSLLLENRRTDDAIRQLRLALGIDPRQPGLAMVLARLQLEKGGPALDTLLKTLPYAGNSADYHAFLAGVLQREQRHTEAADHYRAALQLAPQNAVWWMGLGISLQADQHLPEAREAYNRARSTGGLTPELRSFVDRKIDQLSR
ncbi:MSHA biogenesis protein MshN [Duganella sp. CF402]|uniref:tetratricopeptide repeat protein n=1 Tax=unclassified Duganella TaxID=2636909 RepID=UPI0008B372EF|nr:MULTISPECIES: tetratricopeptide repeat protein [unclassified Duganella]RZT10785.1 MSHA biogenesis protein MshN [Duganella sp. BK701]SEK96655.1 MSHA biogenesis protein MshN [Duganella sp. CF402]